MPAETTLSRKLIGRVRSAYVRRLEAPGRSTEREQDAPAAPRVQAPPIALIARLQRSAGNHATTALIQRYDAFEHAQEGDKAAGKRTLNVGGETLTSGEINALADLY